MLLHTMWNRARPLVYSLTIGAFALTMQAGCGDSSERVVTYERYDRGGYYSPADDHYVRRTRTTTYYDDGYDVGTVREFRYYDHDYDDFEYDGDDLEDLREDRAEALEEYYDELD